MLNTSTVWEEPRHRAHHDQWPGCVTLGWGINSLFTFGFTLHRTSSKRNNPRKNKLKTTHTRDAHMRHYFGFIIIPLIITAYLLNVTHFLWLLHFTHFLMRNCQHTWNGTREQHISVLAPFEHSDVSGEIPILTCRCAYGLRWLLNDLGQLYRRSLPWQLPWPADGLCKAV